MCFNYSGKNDSVTTISNSNLEIHCSVKMWSNLMTKGCNVDSIERQVIYTWCPQLMKVPIIQIIKVARDLQRMLTVKFCLRHAEFERFMGQSHGHLQTIFFLNIATPG